MSRGFVREGDQEEVPMVPQRAYLPNGVPNFVTLAGMEQLLAEKQLLINEREKTVAVNENERRIAVNFINAKLQLLNDRIADARVVDPKAGPHDEIRFGAFVTIRNEGTGRIQEFQIVGVDEAGIAKGKISFISPLSRALMNKKAGARVTLKQERGEIVFEVVDVEYR